MPIVTLALGVLCLALGGSPESAELVVLLLVLALGVEAAGVALFSGAPAVYLAAGLHPEVGVRAAVLLVVAGLVVRQVRVGRVWEDGLPTLGGLAVLALLPGQFLLALVVYVTLLHFLPGREMMFPQAVAVGCLAYPLAGLLPWWGLLVVPALVVPRRAALAAAERDQARAEVTETARDKLAAQEARQLGAHLKQARRDLSVKVEERVLLEELTRAFARAPDLPGTLDLAIDMLGRLVPSESIVFFLGGMPARWRSPSGERLASAHLLGISEPIVAECSRARKPLLSQPHHLAGERLLADPWAVALPLLSFGVLYLGGREKLSREQLKLVALVVDQTVPALLAARRYSELQEALKRQESTNVELEAANRRLSLLLEGFAGLARELERFFETLETVVRGMVPEHTCGALWEGRVRRREWPSGAELDEVARTVLEQGRPLLIEELSGSRFAVPGCRSLLAVPLGSEGAVVVAASAPGVFRREHQEMLMALGYHASALMRVISSQRQLIQSGKMAAVGQLAAGVAHELNSPLAAVLVTLQSLRRSLAKGRLEKAGEQVTRAEGAVESAKTIVAGLLEHSRPSSEGVEAVDLVAVARDSLALVRLQAGVEILEELAEVPPVTAIRGELAQVVTNLVLNARDAGAARVVVRTGVREGRVFLAVEDDGPGVPEEIADRLFEPFFTTKPVGQGTGLGLSISHTIVERHGGQLWHEQAPGGGARFVMAFSP